MRHYLSTKTALMLGLLLAAASAAPVQAQDQNAINRAQAFLNANTRGRDVLSYVHAGSTYRGHTYQQRVGVKGKPGDFALIYRFNWENDGISDVAFLCDGAGIVYEVQVTYTNAVLQQPFAVANLSINLLGNALLGAFRNQMQPEEIQRAQQFIDSANARALLGMSLRLQQSFGR